MKRPLRVLIADDEEAARERLVRLLAKVGGCEVVAQAKDGLQAVALAQSVRPDIAFLDIEMPGLNGLEIARSFDPGTGPAVIFCTAYDEHALEAFECGTIDYLVKPVVLKRLEAALARGRKNRGPFFESSNVPLGSPALRTDRIALRLGAKFLLLEIAKIAAIIGRDHYSGVIYEGRELLSDEKLDTFETRLEGMGFLRLHRSALVNARFVTELEREAERRYIAVLGDSARTRLPIARERLNAVKAAVGITV